LRGLISWPTFRFFSNYFQLSEHLQAGEHGLSIDTDVALWIEYRKYNKRPDLRQVMDFVIVNSEQHSEFDEFKRAMNDPDCVLLSSNALLDYWNEFERSVSQSTITVYGQKHHKLHYTEMDQLIEWVMKQREKRSEGEVVANDTGPITNEISIEQVEENIPHSPSKEEASSFVASKEEISPAAI
jgi:hypothetical protein